MASNIGQSEEFVSPAGISAWGSARHIHWRSWAKAGKTDRRNLKMSFFVRHALVLDTFTPRPHSEVFEERFRSRPPCLHGANAGIVARSAVRRAGSLLFHGRPWAHMRIRCWRSSLRCGPVAATLRVAGNAGGESRQHRGGCICVMLARGMIREKGLSLIETQTAWPARDRDRDPACRRNSIAIHGPMVMRRNAGTFGNRTDRRTPGATQMKPPPFLPTRRCSSGAGNRVCRGWARSWACWSNWPWWSKRAGIFQRGFRAHLDALLAVVAGDGVVCVRRTTACPSLEIISRTSAMPSKAAPRSPPRARLPT